MITHPIAFVGLRHSHSKCLLFARIDVGKTSTELMNEEVYDVVFDFSAGSADIPDSVWTISQSSKCPAYETRLIWKSPVAEVAFGRCPAGQAALGSASARSGEAGLLRTLRILNARGRSTF